MLDRVVVHRSYKNLNYQKKKRLIYVIFYNYFPKKFIINFHSFYLFELTIDYYLTIDL